MTDTLENMMTRRTDLQNDKAQLLSQIRRLDDALACVNVRITEIQDVNRNTYTSNLPNEILSAVFEAGLCLPPTSKYPPEKPFEILVSHVSRRWRSVALRTHRLWTEVSANMWSSAVELLDLYLARSGGCLLDIKIEQIVGEDGDSNPEFETRNFERHLKSLAPHAARWKNLSIHADFNRPLSELLSPLTDIYAPALGSFSFGQYAYCVDPRPTRATYIDLFTGGTPVLFSVELNGNFVYEVRPPRGVKYLSLRYCLNGLTHADLRDILQPMCGLTHLVVGGNIVRPTINQEPVELPSVLSLHVFLLDSNAVGTLRCLHLPALDTLTINGSPTSIFEFLQYYHSTYHTLRSLKLISNVNYYDTHSTNDIITIFPSVQEIIFDGTDSTSVLHTLRNGESADRPLWPELQKITVVPLSDTRRVTKTIILSRLTELVESRAVSGQPITHIKLSSKMIKYADKKQLQRLRENVLLEWV
jgi:F-box-like